jgi:hypothetical protein
MDTLKVKVSYSDYKFCHYSGFNKIMYRKVIINGFCFIDNYTGRSKGLCAPDDYSTKKSKNISKNVKQLP